MHLAPLVLMLRPPTTVVKRALQAPNSERVPTSFRRSCRTSSLPNLHEGVLQLPLETPKQPLEAAPYNGHAKGRSGNSARKCWEVHKTSLNSLDLTLVSALACLKHHGNFLNDLNV